MIQANSDSGTFNEWFTGSLNLLDNDTLSWTQATTGSGGNINVSLTWVNSLTGSYIDTSSQSGTFIIPSSTLSGTYTLSYQICQKTRPLNCSTATLTITILRSNIQANSDSGTFTEGSWGRINILSNDVFSWTQANTGNVTVTLTWGNSFTGSSLDPNTGEFIIPKTTQSWIYTLSYQICEQVNLNNCSTATITVTITRTDIQANSDSGTFTEWLTGTITLLDNDTLSW
jgi:hypothetical protein